MTDRASVCRSRTSVAFFAKSMRSEGYAQERAGFAGRRRFAARAYNESPAGGGSGTIVSFHKNEQQLAINLMDETPRPFWMEVAHVRLVISVQDAVGK